jgi:Tol biopolymer transport system component
MKIYKWCLVFLCILLTAIPAIAQDDNTYGSKLELVLPHSLDLIEQKNRDDEILTKDEARYWDIWYDLANSPNLSIWSPDGEWIAMRSSSCIWIVSADGGEPKPLTNKVYYEIDGRNYYGLLFDASFTPDGEEITFHAIHYDEDKGSIIELEERKGRTYIHRTNAQFSIESVNISTGEHRFIAEGQWPSWSRDGRYLCYANFDHRIYTDESSADHNNALTILDTETGEKHFLTDGSQYCGVSEITPDNSAVIATLISGPGEYQLVRIPFEGGEPEQLTIGDNLFTGHDEYVTDIDISPDGEWIAYTFGSNETAELSFLSLITGETFKMLPDVSDTEISGGYGRFSPDGKKICYTLRGMNYGDGQNIYIKDIDLDSYMEVNVEENSESFVLLNNYPNPFNPVTTIEFTIPEAGFAELSVYNIAGQKVRELVSSEMTAGIHSAVWDGRDQQGNPVSSGVFISRLRTRDNVFSNRMILVR